MYRSDYTFMTNADTPYLVTKNLIINAKNPFTNKEFSMDSKVNGIDVYANHDNWTKDSFPGDKTIVDRNPIIYHVSKNVLDIQNWIRK